MKTRASFLAILVVCGCTVAVQAKHVACIGDSITYGAGIADRTNDSYPAQLQRILRQYDPAWQVTNFGVSGATLLHRGDLPYIKQSAYTSALASKPDIVVIKLGTNDSKPQNWQYKDDFVADYSNMIDAFRALPSKPVVWICKPVPAFAVNFTIRPDVIRDEILPLIEQISLEKNVPVIDLYTALLNSGNLFPDTIHPNAEGAGVMARTIAPFHAGRAVPARLQLRRRDELPGFRPAGAVLAPGRAGPRCRSTAERRRGSRLSGPRRPRHVLDDLSRPGRSLEA